MLVLTQEINGSAVITDEHGNHVATVTVTSIDGKRARIGYTADRRYKILRSELVGTPARVKPQPEQRP